MSELWILLKLFQVANHYRLIPKDLKILVPVKTKEKGIKLLKITSKVSIKGNRIQYGFHDGKTLISEDKQMNVGDVCVVKLPKISKYRIILNLMLDVLVLVIQGENAGRIGKIDEIKNGMFSLPKEL